MTRKTQSLSFYVCFIRLQKPSPSFNSIRKRIQLWKYFCNTWQSENERTNDVECRKGWLWMEKNHFTEKIFIPKLWNINREKVYSSSQAKIHFHLTFIPYIVQITLSWHKALAGKSTKRAKNNPFFNRRNNIVIVYCLIWIHRANNFPPSRDVLSEGIKGENKKAIVIVMCWLKGLVEHIISWQNICQRDPDLKLKYSRILHA